jgi:hypothetical protein
MTEGRPVTTTFDVGLGSHATDAYVAATHNGLGHQRHAHWPATAWTEEAVPLMSKIDDHSRIGLFDLDGAVGLAVISHGGCDGWVSAASEAQADAAMRQLRHLVPVAEAPAADVVPVTFWSYGPHGPQSIRRHLEAPAWEDVQANYPDATRQRLDPLMDPAFRPGRGGQLILWHGAPGTGKTTSLRALAREWRDWAELHYVADPEQFFGTHADYMLQVLLEAGDDHGFVDESGGPARWRVLVLEDTAELLVPDARTQSMPQALSRFLNAVDGLIGQGLRFLVLVTTNEQFGTLHPAVARPGRCAAEIEYERFRAKAASQWLRDHGAATDDATENSTLAELYAQLEGFEGARQPEKLGFVP